MSIAAQFQLQISADLCVTSQLMLLWHTPCWLEQHIVLNISVLAVLLGAPEPVIRCIYMWDSTHSHVQHPPMLLLH